MTYLEQMLADGMDNLVYHIPVQELIKMGEERHFSIIDYNNNLVYIFPDKSPYSIN